MATQISVTGRRDIFAADRDRIGKQDRVVFYQVDGEKGETYFVVMPREKWTEAAERDAIAKAESERKLSKTVTFTIP